MPEGSDFKKNSRNNRIECKLDEGETPGLSSVDTHDSDLAGILSRPREYFPSAISIRFIFSDLPLILSRREFWLSNFFISSHQAQIPKCIRI